MCNVSMSHTANISSMPSDCLLHIFQTLPLRDIINCGRVCRSWRQLIRTKQLWKNVALEGLHIINWKEAAVQFVKWRTVAIDFSNCGPDSYILPSKKLCNLMVGLRRQLRCLRFEAVTTEVLECLMNHPFQDLERLCVKLLTTNEPSPHSQGFVEYFDFGKLKKLQRLKELRINLDDECISHSSFSFHGGLNALGNLTQLRILSLTSLKKYKSYEFGFLSKLSKLVELQLGDSAALPPEVLKTLSGLHDLRKLSLLNGDCCCASKPCQCKWPDAVANLVNLVELELEFVSIMPKLNGSLQKLSKLRKLKVVPLEPDFIPNLTTFTVKDAKKSEIVEVLEGLTHLQQLTWAVWCPLWAFTKTEEDDSIVSQSSSVLKRLSCVTDKTGTLTALKDMLQICLPETEIVVLPVMEG